MGLGGGAALSGSLAKLRPRNYIQPIRYIEYLYSYPTYPRAGVRWSGWQHLRVRKSKELPLRLNEWPDGQV